jgi:hypothetical protein
VFVAPDGRPHTYHYVRRVVLIPALKQAGIKYEKGKTAFNLFRRSMGTLLMKDGGLMQAQTQLRHGSPTTTATHYLSRDESVVHDNTALIESAFFVRPESSAVQ